MLACALTLLAGARGGAADEKSTSRDEASKPSEDAVKLLRLNVRSLLQKHASGKDKKLSFKDAKALFGRFDKSEDGSLDREELTAAVKGLAGEGAKADQHVIAFLREHDANKDSKFSEKEAKIAFDGADTDKDGLLDENELVAFGSRLLPPAKAPPPKDTGTPPTRTDTPTARQPRRLISLLGLRVVIGRDDGLGKVVDLVVDEEGRIAYLVVRDTGGLVAVPWGAVRYSAEAKSLAVTARVTRASLTAVTFAEGRYPDFTSEAWLKGARAAWGEKALPAGAGARPAQKGPGRNPDGKRPPVKERPVRPGERP